MNRVLMSALPEVTEEVKGPWSGGYPVHAGYSKESLNYATVWANDRGLVPDQAVLKEHWQRLVVTLREAGFTLDILPFPARLNQPDCLYHDAVFIRDAGMMYGDRWIQGNFSARGREYEAEVWGEILPDRYGKELVVLPEHYYLEFGEVFYLETAERTYYFGGLSRSSAEAHYVMREIIQPDEFLLIRSRGYHLDTVFTPVLDPGNLLRAVIVAEDSVADGDLAELEELDLQVIRILPEDSSGQGESLGNYAVNALVGPGVLVNCCRFGTPGVEERLKELEVRRFVTPLEYFRYAGGSVHCLTNEVFEKR